MVNLRQRELAEWQKRNFRNVTSEKLALGMAEEVGELCHYILKRMQKIRKAADEQEVQEQIADAFGDTVIFGVQLMETEGMNAEKVIKKTIEDVLKRDWLSNPKRGVEENVISPKNEKHQFRAQNGEQGSF